MPGGFFSYALLAGLATALLVAAVTDWRRREIDNGLNAGIALAAPLWWLAAGLGWADVAFQLVLAAVTFGVAAILFAMRQMGGGDLKLLTALALWYTPASFVHLVVLMAVIGGGASIAMALFNMRRLPGETLRDAIAALAALVWVWLALAIVFAIVTGRPLIAAQTLALVQALPLRAWALGLAGLATILILAMGFQHILRRQKSRLPVPYGIAISAAGLWILADQTFFAVRTAAPTG